MRLRSLVLADTLRIGVLTALVKLAGAFKMVVLARFFGAGDSLDAYLMAFLIPAFASDSLAGAITPAVLPVLMEVRVRQGAREASQLYSNVLLAGAGVMTIAALLAGLFASPIIQLVAPGFNPLKVSLASRLLLLMLPILPLSALNLTWRTLLNADERFVLAAATPLVTPFVIVAAVVLFGDRWGIYALAAGTTAGAGLEIIVLAVALFFAGIWVRPRWAGRSDASTRTAHQYVSVAASNLIGGGSSLVDQIMASSLPAGSVSILSYGTRLVGVFLAVGPASLSAAMFPRFSRLTAAGNSTELMGTFRKYAVLSVAATIPLTAALMYWSDPLARLLFERGAFTSADAHAAALVQMFALLQIPVSMPLMLLVRVVAAQQANQLLLGISVLNVVANFGLDLVLMRWMGVPGIALATTLVQALTAAVLWGLIKRRPNP